MLLARFPDDPQVLYNYGMMLSDQRQVETAARLLQHLVEIAPDHSHGWTALGVALSRAGQRPEALRAFQRSLAIDPANTYAARNAAAIIAETNPAEALPLFEKAVAVLKNDQQTLLGYGTCLLSLGRKDEADRALNRCIEISPLSDTAEQARVTRTKMAHASMRSAVGGGLRPDVVMYCLDALRVFEEGGRTKASAVTMEIALLGRNGLDINDPTQKYTLKSLPGQFSGMRLVSMMYAGFKLLAPDQDAGIDLSREYAEAKRLFEAEKDKGAG